MSLGTVTGERVPVTINGEPVEVDAPGFKGLFHVIHDTGNEPGAVKPPPGGQRKGLMVSRHPTKKGEFLGFYGFVVP